MILPLWPDSYTRSIIEPESPALGLFMGDFEPLSAPYALDSLVVNLKSFPP